MNIYDLMLKRYGDPDEFLRRTRDRMRQHGIKQTDLAARAGILETHVSKWFRGVRVPRMESMVLLDEALDELIEEQKERNRIQGVSQEPR